jgi:hypothetical protein
MVWHCFQVHNHQWVYLRQKNRGLGEVASAPLFEGRWVFFWWPPKIGGGIGALLEHENWSISPNNSILWGWGVVLGFVRDAVKLWSNLWGWGKAARRAGFFFFPPLLFSPRPTDRSCSVIQPSQGTCSNFGIHEGWWCHAWFFRWRYFCRFFSCWWTVKLILIFSVGSL